MDKFTIGGWNIELVEYEGEELFDFTKFENGIGHRLLSVTPLFSEALQKCLQTNS